MPPRSKRLTRHPPIDTLDVRTFGALFRRRELTAVAAVEAYLARIETLDPDLRAFEHVDHASALRTASAMDALFEAGLDLGPLMGVAVAIKDNLAVDGMPFHVGSNVDVRDLVPHEGSFVGRLRKLGCVIIGKTALPEFSIGRGGVNLVRGTPLNPWSSVEPLIPEGSSSGSAVAVAASLVPFAIGTDTGGSVRCPAAFCGVVGLKTTKTLWSTDGVFQVSGLLDTIGPIARSVADARLIFSAIAAQPEPGACRPERLRLGLLEGIFLEGLEPPVAACFFAAVERLEAAGVEIVRLQIPEAGEAFGPGALFTPLVPAEMIAYLGRERFAEIRDRMDPTIAERIAVGLDVTADTYIRLIARQQQLRDIAAQKMDGFDGWITPTMPLLPPTLANVGKVDGGRWYVDIMARNTKPVSVFGMCAISVPIQRLGAVLPVGLQIICRGFEEARLLGIASLVEDLVGVPQLPALAHTNGHKE